MKFTNVLTAAALVAWVGVMQYEIANAADEAAAAGIAAVDMGLSKTSVFDEPTPVAPAIGGERPQVDSPGAPPQVPHDITGMVPVTIAKNACLGCHDQPAMRGKKLPGVPTAIPVSHYENTRDGNAVGEKVRGQRYVCTQCHAPQADVKPLVSNTF